MKVIDMKDVSWRRQRKPILTDINWEVVKGQHWAVLGLNGSGKTSLLNMVNGYIWPTTGRVCVLGQPFGKTDIVNLRRSIGWVSSSLKERIKSTQMTQSIVVSGKYASTGLYDNPTESDFQKAYQIMENLGCSNVFDRTYGTCSNGERQKILIARGLMASPELLILDEPSNGLDFIAREELMTTIHRLINQEDAPTIILVTHHMEEILPVFTHTLMLKQGSVFRQGKREDTINNARLSEFFGKAVQVNWDNHRAWVSLTQ